MPDMGKRFSHHTNRENPLTRNIDTECGEQGQKKQCHVDTARNKSPAITGMEQQGSGRGSCSTPIRTMTERTKNSSAAITPWNIH